MAISLFERLYGFKKPEQPSALQQKYLQAQGFNSSGVSQIPQQPPTLVGSAQTAMHAPNGNMPSANSTYLPPSMKAYYAVPPSRETARVAGYSGGNTLPNGGVAKNEDTLKDLYDDWFKGLSQEEKEKYKDNADGVFNSGSSGSKAISDLEELYNRNKGKYDDSYNSALDSLNSERSQRQQALHNMSALQRKYTENRMQQLGLASGNAPSSNDIKMRNSLMSNLGAVGIDYDKRKTSADNSYVNSIDGMTNQYNDAKKSYINGTKAEQEKKIQEFKNARSFDMAIDYESRLKAAVDGGDLDSISKIEEELKGANGSKLTAEHIASIKGMVGNSRKGVNAKKDMSDYNDIMGKLGSADPNLDELSESIKKLKNSEYLTAEQKLELDGLHNEQLVNKEVKDTSGQIEEIIKKNTDASGKIKYEGYQEIEKLLGSNAIRKETASQLSGMLDDDRYNFESKDEFSKRPENYAERGAISNMGDKVQGASVKGDECDIDGKTYEVVDDNVNTLSGAKSKYFDKAAKEKFKNNQEGDIVEHGNEYYVKRGNNYYRLTEKQKKK